MKIVERPDALPVQSRIVHIGLPKTGTSALQASIWAAREPLSTEGVRVMGKVQHHHAMAIRAAGVESKFHTPPTPDRWLKFARSFRTSTERITWWSSEALTWASRDRVKGLADELGPDTTLMVTCRPLAALLTSGWQQNLNQGASKPLEQNLADIFGSYTRSQDSARPGRLERLDLARIAEVWGEAFGEDRLLFVVAPPGERDFNFRVTESLFSVGRMLQPIGNANASLQFPEAELLRHFNQRVFERGGDLNAVYQVLKIYSKGRVQQVAQEAERHPIRPPQWAVERSREITAGWLDRLESTGVTFVGDPKNLLEDPTGFPEAVDQPAQVDMKTASALMHALYQGVRDQAQAEAVTPERGIDDHTSAELLRTVAGRVKRRIARR